MKLRRLPGIARWKRVPFSLLAIATVTVVAACGGTVGSGGSASGGSSGGGSSSITLLGQETGPNVQGFNPFSDSSNEYLQGVVDFVYEPLLMTNLVHPTQIKPWLASKYAWSDGGKTLTFTIPSDRKWTDGKPLSAQDVAFTYNLIKRFPALNVNGIADLVGASAPNATTAVLKFSSPAYAQLFDINEVLIVPEHIWSQVSNPATYADDEPVGSGPYKLDSITAESMTFSKNPSYWQAGRPKIQTVHVPVYTSANSADEALASGQLDWSALALTDPRKQFTGIDPQHNVLWLPTVGDYFLCPNTKDAELKNASVRRAIAISFNRDQDIPEGEHGFYAPEDNPTGLYKGQEQYMPSQYASQTLAYDAAKARQELIAAGLKGGPSGYLRQANGQPFKLSILLPSGYTDWMTDGQLMVNQMKAAGIEASLDGVSINAWTSDSANGDFQLTFCGDYVSNGPYTTYNLLLNSSLTAPIGKSAVSNIVRWNDPATDAALEQYRSTGSVARQDAAMKKIATIVARQAPVIPLMTVSSFGQYSTKNFTGFPGPNDPYQSDGLLPPYPEDVILHLKPR